MYGQWRRAFQSGQHSGKLKSDLEAHGTVEKFSVGSVRSAFRETEKYFEAQLGILVSALFGSTQTFHVSIRRLEDDLTISWRLYENHFN